VDQFLIRTGAVVLALGAISLLAGLAFGSAVGWGIFGLSVLVVLIFHVWHLRALSRWLSDPQVNQVPEGRGIWEHVLARLYHFARGAARQKSQLVRALARSREAGQALPDGVVVLDQDNRIEWCNENAEAHFGLAQQADVGQPITNLARQPEFVAYVKAGDFSKPIQLRSARGGQLILSVQLIPYGDAQKLLLSRDITQLERIETMRRDFVANVSHELRTPLTVLAGFLETVRELKLDPQRMRDYLNLMDDQTTRMQRIVEDLLTLSTLESAPEPSKDQRLDVARLLAKLESDAEALSGGRHHITLDAAPGFDLTGAESEIASAFGNLVSNAIRYTPPGGDVRVLWRASLAGAEFVVEDTGVGIEARHIPRLTERFYRVDRGRSRETGGTGLGLAIVKHALMRHQATLEIQSEPGKGSRFTACFPARRVVPATARPQNAATT
jgi:two-component system phosphate regulon sensor histidine kinase PhoR